MANNFNATAGDGTVVGGAEDIGGVKYPQVVPVWGPVGTINKPDIATGKPFPVQLRGSDGTDRSNALPVTVASGGIASGGVASGAVASGAFASGAISDGADVTQGAKADAANTATDTTAISIMSVLKQVSKSVQLMVFGAGTAAAAQRTTLASDDPAVATLGATTGTKVVTDANGTIQQYLRGLVTFYANALGAGTAAAAERVTIATDQTWPTGMSPRSFSVAFATLTRPANTTPYSAGNSISDNATAGSVSALVSGNVSDTNDNPVTLTEIKVSSTDTGLAGKRLRAYVFNSDPTANSGVGAGNGSAYSQKVAGYVGSFEGWMETGFSDGTVGRLVPMYNETNNTQAGSFIVSLPATGAKTFWVQYQAVDAFTPSANSTTIIGTIKGFQGRPT